MSLATSPVAMWSRIGPALRSQKSSSAMSVWRYIRFSSSVRGKAKGAANTAIAWSSDRKQRSGLLVMMPRGSNPTMSNRARTSSL